MLYIRWSFIGPRRKRKKEKRKSYVYIGMVVMGLEIEIHFNIVGYGLKLFLFAQRVHLQNEGVDTRVVVKMTETVALGKESVTCLNGGVDEDG